LGITKDDIATICLSNLLSNIITNDLYHEVYETRADHTEAGEEVTAIRTMTPEQTNQVVARQLERHGLSHVPVVRTHHHLNHAAAAYFGMRNDAVEPHLVITLDSGGDGDCSHVYLAANNELRLIASTPSGNSIGNIYTSVTHFLGMTPHEHEYKVMGLAAYAKKDYVESLVEKFRSYVDVDPDNPLIFRRKTEETTTNIAYRIAQDFKRQRFDNVAGALQAFTEELILKWVKNLIAHTGIRKLVVAGGVFMNIKVNALISKLEEVEYFQVFPSCGDESLPFGALWLNYVGDNPERGGDIRFDSFCLGPDSGFDLESAMHSYEDRLEFSPLDDPDNTTAQLLAEGNIVARCSGRMEFGARGLGNRSLLADPARFGCVQEINAMIKQRDFYMPFAPAVLIEQAEKYIDIPEALSGERISPYMMMSFDSTDKRSDFAAAVHQYDRTARAQIVNKETYPEFHRLLSLFGKITDRPVLLNTSYNLHGFPLVLGANDAMDVMCRSSLKYLVINNVLVTKRES
ncbi:MAG: putative Carbamoyltransferase, NodU family, partial [Paenibacillus sp.]|nr:putative Carbamoyltransferase, NodU family [Paenibacillus sp.]